MLVFFDCEFTKLTDDARMLSFGAIGESGESFYRELYPMPEDECSEFVRATVLPLFEGGTASCLRQTFFQELAGWLENFQEPTLLCDSDWDIYVITCEMGHGDRHARKLQLPDLPSIPICLVTDMPGSTQAAIAEGKQQFWLRNPTCKPHHALNDARALALGWQATRMK